MSTKKWEIAPMNKELAAQLADDYGYPPFLALLLVMRGMVTKQQIDSFLQSGGFSDPMAWKDMSKAVSRINRALDSFEKIAVYGDYDADGVTATALLYTYLETRGADVVYYIPQRNEDGYGMSCGGIDRLSALETQLIITVDNGISAVKEIAYAASLGIDTVVTDHHAIPEVIPEAVAVINPHQADCPSAYKDFCGVGVVFKLICALEGDECDIDTLLDNYSDLIAVGTVGDIVPLTGENRTLVKHGLKKLAERERIGLRNLIHVAGITADEVSAGDVSFKIVPRINALGRMSSSEKAVQLLISDDDEETAQMAEEMNDSNHLRQEYEQNILEKVCRQLTDQPRLQLDRVLVVWGEGWHQGVLGIVAARITEKYGKPCVILSVDGENAKGSARSIEGFSLHQALTHCEALLLKYGGHTLAAGMELKAEKLPAFRAEINRYAREFNPTEEMPLPVLHIDCKLNPAQLNLALMDQISQMEPFGAGNPTPVFGLFHLQLEAITPIGGGKHLRLTFRRKDIRISALLFGTTAEEFCYSPGEELDLAVTLGKSEFRGAVSLSIFIKDIRPSSFDVAAALLYRRKVDAFLRGEGLSEEEKAALLPSHTESGILYRVLKSSAKTEWNLIQLCYQVQKSAQAMGVSTVTLGKVLISLFAMSETGIIVLKLDGETARIFLQPVDGKVQLENAKIMQRLQSAAC